MADLDEPTTHGPLDWLHYDVILASRTSYPLPLMIGFTLYGNIMLRRESAGQRYPNWIFGWPVGLIVYTYPASAFSEMVFQSVSPRIFANNQTLCVYTFWFLMIQFCDPVYKFCLGKNVFTLITTWWLADATRVSLLTIERAVTHTPTISRGVWQAFFWCAVVPIARCIELSGRGLPTPKLEQMVPNTLNFFRHPLISMFFIMIFYFAFMIFGTDCNLFAKEGALTMVECGTKYQDVYAGFVYFACLLHLARSAYELNKTGRVVFGETFCLGSGATTGDPSDVPAAARSDLQAPLLPGPRGAKQQ